MNKIKWNLENIKEGFERFFKEHGRYPTSHEIDDYPHLPSARQIQRNFGGLPYIRKQFKLDGPQDFTKGSHSSERAKVVGRRAHISEKKVYDYLVEKFGAPFVHREYFFSDDRRIRVDFFVHSKDGNFYVDAFYPKDRRTLIGCLNSKLRTYSHEFLAQEKYPLIFLMLNEDISNREIERVLSNKKNKLSQYQRLMDFKLFKEYCEGKGTYSIVQD